MSYNIVSRLFIRLGLALFIALAALATHGTPLPTYAQSSTLVVNSLNDPGIGICDATECTLREAIAAAPDGSTITFAISGMLNLSAGELLINKNLIIQGPGLNLLTINAGGTQNLISRVFEIMSTRSVTIASLVIYGGNVGPDADGGGILNHGTLTLNNVGISDSQARSGGGIYNDGNLTMTNSLVVLNTASSNGGGIVTKGILNLDGVQISSNRAIGASSSGLTNLGGGVFIEGTAVIRRSAIMMNSANIGAGVSILSGSITIDHTSIADNRAISAGGGIFQYISNRLSIQSVTITNNSAAGGGAMYILSGSVTAAASIIAKSKAAINNEPDITGAAQFQSQGYNLIGIAEAGLTLAPTDRAGTATTPLDPKLGSIVGNGGPTQYQIPLPGSPVIDAIPAANCLGTSDQRGMARPQGTGCDIGAVEVSASSVNAGGPYITNEGRDVVLNATGSDPDGSPLTYRWDLEGTGFLTAGQQATIVGKTLNGPATLTVRVQVTNAAGLQAISQTTITVLNLRPSATISVPQNVFGGQSFTLALLNATDPSPLDTLSYAFDCGDGLGFRPASSSASISCTTKTTGGELYVRAKVIDNNGAYSSYLKLVDVYPTEGGVG